MRPDAGTCPLYCNYARYLFAVSLFIVSIDVYDGKLSMYILNGGNNTNLQMIKEINDTSNLYWFIYYLCYTFFLFNQLFFLYLFRGVCFNVRRKRMYFNKAFCRLSMLFMFGWGHVYNYYIFYKTIHSMDAYVSASIVSIPINFMIMKLAIAVNDNTIMQINIANPEMIMTSMYNPLIEITTVVN